VLVFKKSSVCTKGQIPMSFYLKINKNFSLKKFQHHVLFGAALEAGAFVSLQLQGVHFEESV
jgi:hypothetical protein